MPDPAQLKKMPVLFERLPSRGRQMLSVPLHCDLSLFAGNWNFPRVVGRVLEDGRVDYGQPLMLH